MQRAREVGGVWRGVEAGAEENGMDSEWDRRVGRGTWDGRGLWQADKGRKRRR